MNVLTDIVKYKKQNIQQHKEKISIADLEKKIAENKFIHKSFFKLLESTNQPPQVIAEIKKSSPSAGVIVENYDPKMIMEKYQNRGFRNISVLTEDKYFQGSNQDLKLIKQNYDVATLQKDFIIDEWQIYQAKAYGADCILLISEILSDREIKQFIGIAASLDMDVLLEFHQVTELSKILNSNLNIIGINNRNLSTLETNPFHALEIRDMFINEFRDHDIVAESGISSTLIIDKYLSNGITKFLIGESLLRESF